MLYIAVGKYQTGYISKFSISQRLAVPDEKVKWSAPWPEYSPLKYTSSHLIGQPWADLDIRYNTYISSIA